MNSLPDGSETSFRFLACPLGGKTAGSQFNASQVNFQRSELHQQPSPSSSAVKRGATLKRATQIWIDEEPSKKRFQLLAFMRRPRAKTCPAGAPRTIATRAREIWARDSPLKDSRRGVPNYL